LWKILLNFLLNCLWHFFFKIKEFVTELFFFQLIILARWQRFATKKITISTHQPGGLEICNGNGLPKWWVGLLLHFLT
jgi:hypothetical protein